MLFPTFQFQLFLEFTSKIFYGFGLIMLKVDVCFITKRGQRPKVDPPGRGGIATQNTELSGTKSGASQGNL